MFGDLKVEFLIRIYKQFLMIKIGAVIKVPIPKRENIIDGLAYEINEIYSSLLALF